MIIVVWGKASCQQQDSGDTGKLGPLSPLTSHSSVYLRTQTFNTLLYTNSVSTVIEHTEFFEFKMTPLKITFLKVTTRFCYTSSKLSRINKLFHCYSLKTYINRCNGISLIKLIMSYVAVSYSELKINLLIKLFGTMEIKTKQINFTNLMITIF